MRKRILAWLLTLCLLLAAVPTSAGAAAGQVVTADSVTVTAGSTATVTIKAANFKNIATLELFVYYDASVLTLNSATNVGLLAQPQTQTVVNTSEVGTIRVEAMSLNGISGSGTLLTLSFATSADAAAGTYPIKVAVGDAYDSDLSAATIGSTDGAVTIQRPTQTERFTLYADMDRTTLQKDDVLSYQVKNSNSMSFVSGDFTVTYDHTLFAVETVEPASELAKGQCSVNTSILGQVRFVYAGSKALSSYSLFTVKLRVLADVDATTSVAVQAANVYREDLSAYLPDSYSRSLTLQKLPEVIDYPDAYLKTEKMVVGEQSKSVFYLEAGASVAAADFTISYDPETLRCVHVQQAEGTNAMIVVNENYAEGKIRFSYINQNGAADTDLPLVEITWEPLRSPAVHYQITSAATGVVDIDFAPVTLEYVTDSNCIFAVTVQEATCAEEGVILHHCAACGKEERQTLEKADHTWSGWKHDGDGHWYECAVCGEKKDLAAHTWSAWTVTKTATCAETGAEIRSCAVCNRTETREIDKIPHDIVVDAAVAATCTTTGLTEGSHCTRCDYRIAQEVTPKLDHDVVIDAAVAATCTATGLTEGKHCSRCDYKVAQKTVPALGHDWADAAYVWAGDNGSVTATRACKRNVSHVERETATATSVVTKEATYAAEGEITYTVTFRNPAFAAQTKTVKTPKLERPKPTLNPFVDVREGEYYYDAVLWAVENGITAGTSATTFSPTVGCTRAQVVTFLWRTAGEPAPTTSNTPFTDVAKGTYYYSAVLWAVEKGITAGTSATTFSPDDTCTRAQIVTFLWRYKGQPEPLAANNPFRDVYKSAYYAKAVLWAAENGVTSGTSASTFSPDDTCTRAQVVTFLYRTCLPN